MLQPIFDLEKFGEDMAAIGCTKYTTGSSSLREQLCNMHVSLNAPIEMHIPPIPSRPHLADAKTLGNISAQGSAACIPNIPSSDATGKAMKFRKQIDPKQCSSERFVEESLPSTGQPWQSLPATNHSTLADRFYLTNPPEFDDLGRSPELERQNAIFERAMLEFTQATGNESMAPTNISSKHPSWAKIILDAKLQMEAYKSKGEGPDLKSKLRGLLRKFDLLQPSIESCISMLPSLSWESSLVCGGLTAILKAASQLGKIRQDTYDAMEEIPQVIKDGYEFMEIYSSDKRRDLLEQHVTQMFVAILDFLAKTLNWYTTTGPWKFASALFKGQDYGREVLDSRAKFQALRESVLARASLNQHWTTKDTHETVDEIRGTTTETLSVARDVQDTMHDGMIVTNLMYRQLKDREETYRWLRERQQSHERYQKRKETVRLILQQEKETLSNKLCFNSRLAKRDLVQSSSTISQLTLQSQDRAIWILKSAEVSSWLLCHDYKLLEIHGNEIEHSHSSATSFFTATLIRALQSSGKATVLYWFCSQHSRDDPMNMYADLIGQILEGGSEEIHLPDGDHRPPLDNPANLLMLLRGFIKQQLRIKSVYLIIDTISLYEDGRERDTHALVERIWNLANTPENTKTWLKIILTSPTKCRYTFRHPDSQASVLNVPEFIDGQLQGLNQGALMESVQSNISPRHGW